MVYLYLAIAVVVLAILLAVALVVPRRGSRFPAPAAPPAEPNLGDDAEPSRDVRPS